MNANLPPVEKIEPYYFGPSNSPLFGAYQPPQVGLSRDAAVVLCCPMGYEYIYGHRSFRQLAIRLNRLGFPVLRFDYAGWGDSAGDETLASFARWLADIVAAVDEAKRRSRTRSVWLVGLRLGASLTALAAAERDDVVGVALWQPIISGQDYLVELKKAHQDRLWRLLSNLDDQDAGQPSEFLGFALNDTLRRDLESLDLLALQRQPAPRLLVVENETQPLTIRLKDHIQSLGAVVEYRQIAGPRIWLEDPDKALVPHQTLQAIVAWIGETKTS